MNLDDILLNEITRELVSAYLARPSHALLLTGRNGAGLGTLAMFLAKAHVNHNTDIILIQPDDKGTIPIERVRELYIETRSARKNRQVVVIDDIDSMSHDAQNAFLKLLEEPNNQVLFIVTSHRPELLLATINSRLQHIDVRSISTKDSQTLLRRQRVSDPITIKQMLFLAEGLPAALNRMANDNDYFDSQATFIRNARDFLTGKIYDRLVIASRYGSREDALRFVQTLANLLRVMGKNDPKLLRADVTNMIEKTAVRLTHNGHVKTHLTNLAFHV